MSDAAADFQSAREAFLKFRRRLDSDPPLCGEVVEAIRALVTEYSTSIRENRFTVGGAIEHIIGAAMRAAGLPARNRGHLECGSDIRVDGVGFSIKGVFSHRLGAVGLINTRGVNTSVVWKDATILVLAGVGIGYVDPVLVPDSTVLRSDQLQLPKKAYLGFLREHPEYLIALPIPANPKSEATRVASYAVAEEILARLHFKALKKFRTSMQDG